jgi:hypothetical protein
VSKNDVSSNEELASDWWEAAKLKIEGAVVDGFENDELMIDEVSDVDGHIQIPAAKQSQSPCKS